MMKKHFFKSMAALAHLPRAFSWGTLNAPIHRISLQIGDVSQSYPPPPSYNVGIEPVFLFCAQGKAVFWRFSMIKSQHCKRGEGERGRVQCSLMSDHDGKQLFLSHSNM